MAPDTTFATEDVHRHLVRILEEREYPKTICPSEAARTMSAQQIQASGATTWRDLMPSLRELAFHLRDEGEVEILQKGKVLSPSSSMEETSGPIRLRKVR